MARSNADLAVLSIFLIKPITSSYCSVILFSTESIRSRLANLFSIRFRKFTKEPLAGDCGGVLEGFGGLPTVFYCFVEDILGKGSCKLTL